jgi:hypothetical protein
MSDTESILPEILIDDTADEYVETDDEPGTPSPKTRPKFAAQELGIGRF